MAQSKRPLNSPCRDVLKTIESYCHSIIRSKDALDFNAIERIRDKICELLEEIDDQDELAKFRNEHRKREKYSIIHEGYEYTVKGYCQLTGISPPTCYRYIWWGKVKSIIYTPESYNARFRDPYVPQVLEIIHADSSQDSSV